eukprot:9335844-Heterocapsa_arctica.AAC.1
MDFEAMFASMRCGYYGEAVAMRCLLTVAEVEPGLTRAGVVASIDAVSPCDAHTAHALTYPEAYVLPDDEWPDVRSAWEHCANGEWERL